MENTFSIAGYTRISVDEEMDRENTSIENQKAIIGDYAAAHFPGSRLQFFEDRDRSGYTFEQREGYQRMRPLLMGHTYDILIVKDFSRFARRNSRGLVELEDLRDQGVRIISIGDAIDYPTYDDWTAIQFRFLINEMPVTDTSKKVRSVIRRRQADGKWICAVPYGYVMSNSKTMAFRVDEPAAEVVRTIFDLYNDGWGYKKIANHLTGLHIPTPRTAERERIEESGGESHRRVRPEWSIVTVQGILSNDFYIGTLRQGKYTRKGINKPDRKTGEEEQIILEKHHESIVDDRVFSLAQEQRRLRTVSHYRGVKKHGNPYAGFLFCGDCGSPLFSMSRKDPAYTCGTYHRRGLAGCTSHYIRADTLDRLLKLYLRRVRENSADMLDRLDRSIREESGEVKQNETTVSLLEGQLDAAFEELKAAKRQRVRDLCRRPGSEDVLNQTYDELEAELEDRIAGLQNQIRLTRDKRNTIIQVNRIARGALELFDAVLKKDALDAADVSLIVDRVTVFTDHLDIRLKSDIDRLLAPEDGTLRIDAAAPNRQEKTMDIHIVSEGDPLEIYTSRDGEVIFKKYSLLGGVEEFAAQFCESLNKSTGSIVAVTDRDTVIAIAGGGRRELMGKRITPELEQLMEGRKIYQYTGEGKAIQISDSSDKLVVSVAAPILSEGDLLGLILFIGQEPIAPTGETEYKLAQTVAGFLGKHMED